MSYQRLIDTRGGFGIIADDCGYEVIVPSTGVRIHTRFDAACCDASTNIQRARLWIADHIKAAKAAGENHG